MSNDTEYYRERARVERALAAHAAQANVAAIHAELATLYEAMIGQPELRPKRASAWPTSF